MAAEEMKDVVNKRKSGGEKIEGEENGKEGQREEGECFYDYEKEMWVDKVTGVGFERRKELLAYLQQSKSK